MRRSALDIAAGSIDAARMLALLLLAAVIVGIVALFVTPWQQSVAGSGRVIAFAPLERQQAIEAPVSARIDHWYVQEGDHVEVGDRIVDLRDNDPSLIERLERQRDAALVQLDAASLTIVVTEAKLSSLQSVRSATIVGADLDLGIAQDNLRAAHRTLDASKAKVHTGELNVTRQRRLHEQGLTSTRTLELAELDYQTARAEVDRSAASLDAARREVEAKAAARDKVDADAQAKVEEARASLEKAKGDRAKAEAELTKAEVELARQQTMHVVAPRSGTVFRMVAKAGAVMVKAGDPLALLVPDTEDRAVELWVDGNDAPLITPGRTVRLQFEGWPAVQFVGWPSVAVGTFAGEVAFVDATDDGLGRFRVVVVPGEPQAWPEPRYLRQGVRANGWILLNQVALGYEFWRQFNGFPPAVQPPGAEPKGGEEKP